MSDLDPFERAFQILDQEDVITDLEREDLRLQVAIVRSVEVPVRHGARSSIPPSERRERDRQRRIKSRDRQRKKRRRERLRAYTYPRNFKKRMAGRRFQRRHKLAAKAVVRSTPVPRHRPGPGMCRWCRGTMSGGRCHLCGQEE